MYNLLFLLLKNYNELSFYKKFLDYFLFCSIYTGNNIVLCTHLILLSKIENGNLEFMLITLIYISLHNK